MRCSKCGRRGELFPAGMGWQCASCLDEAPDPGMVERVVRALRAWRPTVLWLTVVYAMASLAAGLWFAREYRRLGRELLARAKASEQRESEWKESDKLWIQAVKRCGAEMATVEEINAVKCVVERREP